MEKTNVKKDLYKDIKNRKSDSKINGITLISLVVTIIVLLILAGITISILMGNNGIIERTKISKEETKKAEAIEEIKLIILEVQSEKEGKATLADIVQKLKDKKDTYNITLVSQVAVLSQGSIGVEDISNNVEKIYVTNLKYGYEVEVGKNLSISNNGTSSNDSSSQQGGYEETRSCFRKKRFMDKLACSCRHRYYKL